MGLYYMKSETIASKLNPQTANLMSSGGGGFEAINGADIGAVMMAIDAPDLIWAYYFSYYDIGLSYDRYVREYTQIETKHGKIEQLSFRRENVSLSLNLFQSQLKTWIYSKFLNWCNGTPLERINKASIAADEISKGLALYLSTKPEETVRIAKYFRPMPSSTFDRKYRKFVIYANNCLFPKMTALSNKIDKFTKNEQDI